MLFIHVQNGRIIFILQRHSAITYAGEFVD